MKNGPQTFDDMGIPTRNDETFDKNKSDCVSLASSYKYLDSDVK